MWQSVFIFKAFVCVWKVALRGAGFIYLFIFLLYFKGSVVFWVSISTFWQSRCLQLFCRGGSGRPDPDSAEMHEGWPRLVGRLSQSRQLRMEAKLTWPGGSCRSQDRSWGKDSPAAWHSLICVADTALGGAGRSQRLTQFPRLPSGRRWSSGGRHGAARSLSLQGQGPEGQGRRTAHAGPVVTSYVTGHEEMPHRQCFCTTSAG